MLILPAIDILKGKCVRLSKGDYAKSTVYSADPLLMAKTFEFDGAGTLHIVDLDGAKSGVPENFDLITSIANQLDIPVQVGGGIRSFETASRYLNLGVDRIIIGTRAISDFAFVKDLIDHFGAQRILVSMDTKKGKVLSEGWTENSGFNYLDLAESLKKTGLQYLIVTDINRDGMLQGPNLDLIDSLQGCGFKIIASGGISCLNDLSDLAFKNVYGAIIGKALYEGKIETSTLFEGMSNLAKRVIPCLDVKDGRTVKGVNFKDLKDAGDAVELGRMYSLQGADELVFLDVSASLERRKTVCDLVRAVSEQIFIPFTVGGGVKSVEDARELLKNGADKVAINTAAVLRPRLINELAAEFGSQCVVLAVDTKKVGDEYKVFVNSGSEEMDLILVDWLIEAQSRGAGEILLTSIDRDGTKSGFDIELLKSLSAYVRVPLIASGGAGCKEDMRDALLCEGVDSVLAAGVFHYGELKIDDLKTYLSKFVTVRK